MIDGAESGDARSRRGRFADGRSGLFFLRETRKKQPLTRFFFAHHLTKSNHEPILFT